MQIAVKHKRGFTLVEIMVVVAIVALLAVLTLPSIRAMQATSARAQVNNIVNSALQAARSYAIMNSVNTAARFQPNGKVFLVYRVDKQNSNIWAVRLGGDYNTPGNRFRYPLDDFPALGQSYIYLPVVNQEPLEMPKGYAVRNPNAPLPLPVFGEPFYICYRPDGTIANNEPIWVGLTDTISSPVNPSFDGGTTPPAWMPANWLALGTNPSYNPTWKDFIANASNSDDLDDLKIVRFFNTVDANNLATNDSMDKINDADHFGGFYTVGTPYAFGTRASINQISIFPTPDDWDQLPIISSDNKNRIVRVNQVQPNQLETIFINPYTGRIIRPVD